MATRHATRQSSALQRTAPYLGVACLALLALASVQSARGFTPRASATTARGAAIPALSWLAAPAASRPVIAAATHWVGHASAAATTRPAFALADAALLGVVLALLALWLRQVAARARSGLSTPALLVAVALARAH